MRNSSRTIGISLAISLSGLAFNEVRALLRLDQSPLVQSLVAFMLLLAVALAFARVTRLDAAELGISLGQLKPTLAGTALVTLTLVGTALATAPQIRVPSIPQFVGGLAFFGLGTAPAEELLFRGVLYGLLARESNSATALLVSATAFAVAHVPVYGLVSFPIALIAGLLLGWLRWWSRSLISPMIVHLVADLSLLWL